MATNPPVSILPLHNGAGITIYNAHDTLPEDYRNLLAELSTQVQIQSTLNPDRKGSACEYDKGQDCLIMALEFDESDLASCPSLINPKAACIVGMIVVTRKLEDIK